MNDVGESKTRDNVVFTWQPNGKIIVFVLIFLPIFCSLGVWQLSRAEEKRTLQENWSLQQSLDAISDLNLIEAKKNQFRRFVGTGRFERDRYWLIENKTFQGQLGFEVLMPFVFDDGTTLLVNRGWVAGAGTRSDLPKIETPVGSTQIVGNIVEPSDHPLLKEKPEINHSWPKLILEVDIQALAVQLDKKLYTKILQLDAESDAAFILNWRPFNMSPSKHLGYAVQWFSMAIALLLLAVFANSNLANVLKNR